MPNFIKFDGMEACRQYGEMYSVHLMFFLFVVWAISREPLQKKVNHFKLLVIIFISLIMVVHGLKCSTVGNLGS